ncbi:Alanine--tRNA ligase [Lobulomyces angularis]|nr:Alanine--tRNA ligase [Lobulomyces angularis]
MTTSKKSNTQNVEWPVNKVRSTFIKYFEEHKHKYVKSSATVPHDDPTLLFANSGMNQFKPIFQGTVDPNSPLSKLKSACNSQKCIRAGGKHNDLEDVGKDVYHHTFFEMLGNWSFGDYFKKEAISMAWELLTKVYKLPKDRFYVSYFEGDETLGLGPDLEARQFWLDLGVSPDNIVKGNSKDNFWEMGEQGPCGPCSEIHYDHVGNRNAAHLVNKDDPLVVEIWNIVFMQYNREADRSLKPLPKKSIDTGMGLERLVTALQKKKSNYDTDVFMGLFKAIQDLTGARPYKGLLGDEDVDGIDTAYRIVADHLRTLTFAICDGQVPSNEGRGYVLRRILRRGARYVRKKFNIPIGNVFSSLALTLINEMGDFYPEITGKFDDLKEILDEEERSFAKTLDRGEALFEKYIQNAKNNVLSGSDAWRLYDTYGFPVDLTRLMAEEKGFQVNEQEFEQEQIKSKNTSKAVKGNKNASESVVLDVHQISELEKDLKVSKTNDEFKYHNGNINGKIKAIFSNGKFVKSKNKTNIEDKVGIVLDKTNFYAEQGGQEYDQGILITLDDKTEFVVENVQIFGSFILHIGYLKYGTLNINEEVTCIFDALRRWPIKNNHTGTHILNFALQKVLRTQVDQKGSLVAPEKLRFDFTAKSAPKIEQIVEIENICSEFIKKNDTVYSKEVPLTVGRTITGLRAVFGEVYPDPVRVVSVGIDVDVIVKDPTNVKWAETSIEFCGGTHVAKTGDIKKFYILEESSISKGIRRVVAVTGEEAIKAHKEAEDFCKKMEQLKSLIGTSALEAQLKIIGTELDLAPLPIVQKNTLRVEYAKIKKDFVDADKARKAKESKEAVEEVKTFFESNSENSILIKILPTSSIKVLSQAMTHIKTLEEKSGFLFSVDEESNKVVYQVFVSNSQIQKGLRASEWANQINGVLDGKSGGNDSTAQGSGKNIERVQEALRIVEEFSNKFSIGINKLVPTTTTSQKQNSKNTDTEISGKLYSYPNSSRAYKIMIAAEFNKVRLENVLIDVESKENLPKDFIKKFPLGKLPAFEGKDGFFLFESSAITQYIASLRENNLLGKNARENSLIQQWLNFSENEFEALRPVLIFPLLKWCEPSSEPVLTYALSTLKKNLVILDKFLLSETFFIGERISLADIFIFSSTLDFFRFYFDDSYKKEYQNLFRWFETMYNQPEVKKIVGNLNFEKLNFNNNAPGEVSSTVNKQNENKNSKVLPPKEDKLKSNLTSEKQVKKDLPTKTEKLSIKKESQKVGKVQEKVTAATAERNFDLTEFKRFYCNYPTRPKVINHFWETYNSKKKTHHVFKLDYKFNSELETLTKSCFRLAEFKKKLFKLNNLNKNQFFGSVLNLGVDNFNIISGFFIFEGEKIPDDILQLVSSEGFIFTPVNDSEFKKGSTFGNSFEGHFAWDNEVDGLKFANGVIFK